MKYYQVNLGGLDNWGYFDKGNFPEIRTQWTQQPGHWTVFFLEHSGGFMLNNRVTPFDDGFVAVVAPGTKAGFLRTGPDTPHYSATFGITKRTDTVAIPSLIDLGDMREARRKEFEEAQRWVHFSILRANACVFNLLWGIAQPVDVLRSSDLMYDFERLVIERLSEKLSVAALAAELGISPSQLLRSVRAEYNQTAQQFIREKRAEVAKTLVLTTNLSLKQIAAQTGMPDLQYFNKAIRGLSGLSPRALRELANYRTRH
jgi:AraC-like DNA-binding protein